MNKHIRGTGRRLVLLVLVLTLTSCGAPGASNPLPSPVATLAGEPIAVTVRQLIDHSTEYAGRQIRLNGKIALECSQGCWLFLDDGTGMMYVDLNWAGLSIPQRVGSRVEIRGQIKGAGGNLKVEGEEVVFLD